MQSMIHKKLVLIIWWVSIIAYALFPKSPPLPEGAEVPEVSLTTQSVSSEISSSCIYNTDFPNVLLANKEPLMIIPPKGSYTMLAFCSPHAPGCVEMSTKKNLWFEQRDLEETCHFSTLIPHSQWTSWLKTTITKQPFFARKSAGVDATDRQKVQSALSLNEDTLPLFLLIDDCGEIVAQTTSLAEIEKTFGSYCGTLIRHACGNGILEDDEICDDGNLEENDACTALCKPTTCGDEVINTPNSDRMTEQCDDGNTKDDDGCSATCLLEKEHIRYCDADDDSLYSFKNTSIAKNIFPHLIIQKWLQNKQNFAYCTEWAWCRFVDCRHEQGDDCDDTNNNIFSPGSYCVLDGKESTYNVLCTCGELPSFTTQSVTTEIQKPKAAPQWRCGSPDGKFINYPGSRVWIDADWAIRYQCSINNCNYMTDSMCYPNGGVCYYFCGSEGTEEYTTPCWHGLSSNIQTTKACSAWSFCGQK